jgi:hypothetical protein
MVRGEVYFTKTLLPGVISVVSQEFALQFGLTRKKSKVESKVIPSVSTPAKTPPQPKRFKRFQGRKPKNSAAFARKAAARRRAEERAMSDLVGRQEALRRQHIRQFSKQQYP